MRQFLRDHFLPLQLFFCLMRFEAEHFFFLEPINIRGLQFVQILKLLLLPSHFGELLFLKNLHPGMLQGFAAQHG